MKFYHLLRFCLSGYPVGVVAGFTLGGKDCGDCGIPGGHPLIIRFFPGESPAGIGFALRRRTLILVNFNRLNRLKSMRWLSHP